MEIPDNLVLHLAELSEALDDSGADLQAVLAVLVDDLRAAVPSFLGLRMTIMHRDGHAPDGLTLNFLPPALAGDVASTLLMPLDQLGVSAPGSTVIFYAARSGAFVDLAADARFAYQLDGQVVVDGHLPTPDGPTIPSGIFGLAEASTINQAVGVLIAQGHTSERALLMLRERARESAIGLHQAARHVLNSTADDET